MSTFSSFLEPLLSTSYSKAINLIQDGNRSATKLLLDIKKPMFFSCASSVFLQFLSDFPRSLRFMSSSVFDRSNYQLRSFLNIRIPRTSTVRFDLNPFIVCHLMWEILPDSHRECHWFGAIKRL